MYLVLKNLSKNKDIMIIYMSIWFDFMYQQSQLVATVAVDE